MKRKIPLILAFLLGCVWLNAQQIPFSLKVSAYGGYIVPMSENLKKVATKPVWGGEISAEFPAMGNYAWQRYWHMPTLGVSFLGMDLGNKKILGQAYALYPYLLVPIIKREHFEWHWKAAVGLAFISKTWYDCDTLSGVAAATANSSIGSVLNAYIGTGMNFSFPIKKGAAITADIGYTHMSNGSTRQPNSGFNILQAQVGAKYTFEACRHCKKPLSALERFPYDWSITIEASGGVREQYYKDHHRYGVGTFQLGMTANITNCYAIGGALHAFYDGAFVQQGERDGQSFEQHTKYGRYFIPTESAANKFRAGVALNNEFFIGRVVMYFQWGIYVYDPLRNANPEPHKKHGYNRPMFYSYNINNEDGWNYFRLGLRCRIWDNLYVSAAIKSHLHKAEMLTFGIGYQIPFVRDNESNRRTHYGVYHPDSRNRRLVKPNQNQWQPVGIDGDEDPHYNLGR